MIKLRVASVEVLQKINVRDQKVACNAVWNVAQRVLSESTFFVVIALTKVNSNKHQADRKRIILIITYLELPRMLKIASVERKLQKSAWNYLS